jgi:hypothetical protein
MAGRQSCCRKPAEVHSVGSLASMMLQGPRRAVTKQSLPTLIATLTACAVWIGDQFNG